MAEDVNRKLAMNRRMRSQAKRAGRHWCLGQKSVRGERDPKPTVDRLSGRVRYSSKQSIMAFIMAFIVAFAKSSRLLLVPSPVSTISAYMLR